MEAERRESGVSAGARKPDNEALLRPFAVLDKGRLLRAGYTTGTCAAAAAKAAAVMLVTGGRIEAVSVRTPAGPELLLPVEEIRTGPGGAECAVRKDAGDDPDVTDGILVCAAVQGELLPGRGETEVEILGGGGIGTVTRPGLDQPPGEAAINSVPRKMITEGIREVTAEAGLRGRVTVTISVPEGLALAEKTFNPRLGIRGGISILGTEGIVRPMSRRALTDTIRADMRVHARDGGPVLAVPGNYGLRFLEQEFGVPASDPVIMSNYVGEAIDAAGEAGVKELLLAGHLGKFVKLAGGIMNTHSSEADARMELLCAHALRCGASRELMKEILHCSVTQEAVQLLKAEGLLKDVSGSLLRAAEAHVRRRAGEGLKTALIIYTPEEGILAESAEARTMLTRHAENAAARNIRDAERTGVPVMRDTENSAGRK